MRKRMLLVSLASLAIMAAACGESTTTTVGSTIPTTIVTTTTVATPTTTVPAPTTTTTTTTGSTTTSPEAIDFSYAAGVVTGPDRIEAQLGDVVEFTVTSDVTEEVHVHGYDLFFDLIAEDPETVSFTADVPGIFEIELEDSRELLVELLVR